MQKEYFYLGTLLFFTAINLYFMEQSREKNAKLANFNAFAAGFTFMGALYNALAIVWG